MTIRNSKTTAMEPLVIYGVALLAVGLYMTFSTEAYAQFTAPCSFITANMTGKGLVPAIASIGVIMLGVGAMLGKVSWGMAITVAVGISALFGYSALITSFAGTGTAITPSGC